MLPSANDRVRSVRVTDWLAHRKRERAMACPPSCPLSLVLDQSFLGARGMSAKQRSSRSSPAISVGVPQSLYNAAGRSPCGTEGVHDVETGRRQALPQALHHEVPALRGQASMPSAPRLGSERRSRTAEQHLSPHAAQKDAGLVQELVSIVLATFRWSLYCMCSAATRKEGTPLEHARFGRSFLQPKDAAGQHFRRVRRTAFKR